MGPDKRARVTAKRSLAPDPGRRAADVGQPEVASRADRCEILGVQVSTGNLADAVRTVQQSICEQRCTYVCVTGVHGVMESRRDERLREIHNGAGLVVPDGMPIVWMSRLKGNHHTERISGRDLLANVTAVSALHGYRQFYYGGADGVAERLKQVLTGTYPALDVAGLLCPPFREVTRKEDDAIVKAINAARPDIVWIGLSTPKQERWMASHLGRIDAPVMIGVGAAFDFVAGIKPIAPAWMQRCGLEWLFRLYCEPRRLWRRYGYIVPVFAFLAIGELLNNGIRSLLSALGLWPKLHPQS